MTLNQIASLFERDKSVISRHFKKIFNDHELDKNAVVAKNATTESQLLLTLIHLNQKRKVGSST
jgi:hypothetical protein